ncbi:hypothetical protein GCM10009819_28230 [Agromyces tropicus]|uniref:Acyl-CoA carboxylase subunit epsilon n=1 Tax=Agromyces tropicus TaxID=555371 RepID=A0ABP5G8W5_9MICO
MTSSTPEGEALDLRFATRDVTAEEAAAVTAVLVAAVREHQHDAAPEPARRSDWSHPRTALRPRIEVGPGRWVGSAR